MFSYLLYNGKELSLGRTTQISIFFIELEFQPLWVILCCLPEKGRREIKETEGGVKERDRGDKKINESKETEETEEIKTFLLYPYLLQG